MLPFSRLLLATTLGLAPVLLSAAQPAWVERSNANAQLLLELMAKYSPESASQLGVEGYDEQILDLSRDRFNEQQADLRRTVSEYRKRSAGETNAKVKQDLEILIRSAEDNLSSNALSRKYFIPYTDIARLIFNGVQQTIDPRVPEAQQQTLVRRLEKYAGLVNGNRPLTELATLRTLERIKADRTLLGPYKGELEKAIADSARLVAGARELLQNSKVSGWQTAYAALESQIGRYNDWLKNELLPRARADHRLPPEVYADNLHQYGVDVPPEQLISRALVAFAELRTQMQIVAAQVARQRGWPETDYRAVLRRLKQQQLPADQVMATYRQRLTDIEAIVRAERIVTLPNRTASIRLATEAENAQQPAPHMDPPRLIGNTGEYGEFVLTTGMPPDASGKSLPFDDFSHDAVTWTLTAHEARPGHELQFAKMIEAGVSTARAVFAFNSVNVEGWALYAEAEMQPFQPLDAQLVTLQMRAFRAARAFLDPMVNLGQMSIEDAKRFQMEEVVYSEGMATQEVQRYSFRAPGQATSYFHGYQNLMETRQAAQLALRERFDRLAFNDFVLSQGLVPPVLLRQAVMEEFVPAQRAR